MKTIQAFGAGREIATIYTADAKKKMKEEAKVLIDCLDGHSRSKMQWYLLLMHRHGLLQDSDLKEFSEELREQILTSLRGLHK